MTFFSYNNGIPAANNNPSSDQPGMLINCQSIQNLIGVDHITFQANNGGQHKQITFNVDSGAGYPYVPIVPTSPPVLFTQTVNALPELFYYSGDAAHSSDQYVAAETGSTFLFGGIILKWGVFNAATSPQTINYASNFPNNGFNAVLTPRSSSLTGYSVQSTSASSFIFVGTPGVYGYFAIGN